MDDNYEDMASNPLHLQLMMDKRDNADLATDPSTDTQPPIDADTTCQQETSTSSSHSGATIPAASVEQPSSTHASKDLHSELGACSKEVLDCSRSKVATDVKQCWDSLKFSIKEGKLSATAETFSKDASDCVMSIINFFAAQLNDIFYNHEMVYFAMSP